RLDYLDRVDIYEYDVIIFPHGSKSKYKSMLGDKGIERLKNWINEGGTFIGIKGGMAFAAAEDVELTTSRQLGVEKKKKEKGGEEEVPEKKKEGEMPPGEKEMEEVEYTPGSILRVKLNTDYYLAFGYEDEVPVHIYSNLLFTKSKTGANVGVFAENGIRLSGFVWEEAERAFAGKAYLIDEPMGKGHVILFADDPIFRLYWRALDRLFLNSIFLSGSF
ncbi:MAG: BPL-N domain-containing protein, partial [Fidelibacterota bacterium]